jgi:hypothetical protein
VSDLDAIRERHQPRLGFDACDFDLQPWGDKGCDAAQALARVDELEAALKAALDSGPWNSRKTHCPRGHVLGPVRNGKRRCRECDTEQHRLRRALARPEPKP